MRCNNSVNQQSEVCAQPSVTRVDMLKINICIVHAHYRNMEKPGSYEEELNKIFTVNNLPNIIIPETPDSRKALRIAVTQPSASSSDPATQPSASSIVTENTQRKNVNKN